MEPGFGDGFWMCITGGDLDRCIELRDGELVVSMLKLFIVPDLSQGFLKYGLPE